MEILLNVQMLEFSNFFIFFQHLEFRDHFGGIFWDVNNEKNQQNRLFFQVNNTKIKYKKMTKNEKQPQATTYD